MQAPTSDFRSNNMSKFTRPENNPIPQVDAIGMSNDPASGECPCFRDAYAGLGSSNVNHLHPMNGLPTGGGNLEHAKTMPISGGGFEVHGEVHIVEFPANPGRRADGFAAGGEGPCDRTAPPSIVPVKGWSGEVSAGGKSGSGYPKGFDPMSMIPENQAPINRRKKT